MDFLHWVCLYADVTSELWGEDKQAAMKVIDDDAQFDLWLKKYNEKNNTVHTSGKKKGKIDKEDFLNKTQGMLPQPGKKTKNANKDRPAEG